MSKRNILHLAASLLRDHSNILSYGLAPKWKYPEEWSSEECREFYDMFVRYTCNNNEELVERYIRDFPYDELTGPADFIVAGFVASILEEAANK